MINYNGNASNVTGLTQVTVSNPQPGDSLTSANDTLRTNTLADWCQQLASIALNIAATAFTWTMAQVFQKGITVTQSSSGQPGVTATGNGAGPGVSSLGGAGGAGVQGTGGAGGNTNGVNGIGNAGGGGLQGTGGSSGPGASLFGNANRGSLLMNPQADPSAPVMGDTWINNSGVLRYYNGSADVSLAGSASPTAVPSFTNSWAAGTPAPRYWIDQNNIVHLAGQLNAASATLSAAFTLPAGFRPTGTVGFVVPDLGGTGAANDARELTISSAGVVSIPLFSGVLGAIALDGVSFPIF